MSAPFTRGEKLLIRDTSGVELASCVFEFIDKAGLATVILAARTDVTNLQRIEARFERPVLGKDGDLLSCSFCGKSQMDIRKLIAGPGVYVCNECIDICNEIINDEEAVEQTPKQPSPRKRKTRKTAKREKP